MDIRWIGSNYFGYPDGTRGRNGYKPIAIVMHIAEGTLAGCDAWFNSPNNEGSSTHYAVGKNGEIHQYVLEEDAAWGNGQVKQPTWPLLISGVNPNLYTVSIEHEGFTGEPWTEAMFQADVWLLKQIGQRWGIAFDREHIIGHYQIDSVTRPNCPGSGLPWDRLIAALSVPDPMQEQVKRLQQQVQALEQQVQDLTSQAYDLQRQGSLLQSKLLSIGRLVKTDGSPQVYLWKGGVLYPLAGQQTLERLYSPTLVETIAAADIAALPQGPKIEVT